MLWLVMIRNELKLELLHTGFKVAAMYVQVVSFCYQKQLCRCILILSLCSNVWNPIYYRCH